MIRAITSHDRHRPMAYMTQIGTGRNRPILSNKMSSRVCAINTTSMVEEKRVRA
jgi:hypothetical protein